MPTVRVEFYGVARHRVGTATMSGIGSTLGEVLSVVAAAYPALQVLHEDGVSPEYLISLGGARFTTNLAEPLVEGDTVLILGADAGG